MSQKSVKARSLINLESPYAGNIDLNVMYAQFCMHDSIVNHYEAPFASHLLYTQPNVLRDEIPEERTMGITAGRDFSDITEKTVVYVDLGMTDGMVFAVKHAQQIDHVVELRFLPTELYEEFTKKANEMNLEVPKEGTISLGARKIDL